MDPDKWICNQGYRPGKFLFYYDNWRTDQRLSGRKNLRSRTQPGEYCSPEVDHHLISFSSLFYNSRFVYSHSARLMLKSSIYNKVLITRLLVVIIIIVLTLPRGG